MTWEISIGICVYVRVCECVCMYVYAHTCVYMCVCMYTCSMGMQWEPAIQQRADPVLWVDLEWDDGDGGTLCIHIADSLHCTAETKTTW